jgi:hypothetical protein
MHVRKYTHTLADPRTRIHTEAEREVTEAGADKSSSSLKSSSGCCSGTCGGPRADDDDGGTCATRSDDARVRVAAPGPPMQMECTPAPRAHGRVGVGCRV